VRLAPYGAAVVAALVIPGLVEAGDPRLLFDIRPPVLLVMENGGGRDALLTIDARNPGDRRVRVERVRLTYFEGDTPVGTLDPAESVFTQAGLLSDPRVPPGGLDPWEGMCLAPPTSATDRVRFEFDLVARREWRLERATQILDVPLAKPLNPPVIALPFTGTWRVTQGHTCETNHRRGKLGGQFSWDFVAVRDAGQLGAAGFDSSHRNDESATFGRALISPVTGTVVFVVDGVDDNDGQKSFPRRSPNEAAQHPRWFYGNHIVLDAGGGVFVLLAHLKKGSVVVARGAAVQAGDPIAQAGNSGNTMLPHVHIQVMDGADPAGASVTGIPALIRDYVEITSTGEPVERETIIRRISLGDPPVDAVVLTPAPPRRAP